MQLALISSLLFSGIITFFTADVDLLFTYAVLEFGMD